jgi:hypothetical protein
VSTFLESALGSGRVPWPPGGRVRPGPVKPSWERSLPTTFGLRSDPAAFWLAGLGFGGRAPENNRERYGVRMSSASEGDEKPTHGRQAATCRRHDQIRINIEYHVPEALLPHCVRGRWLDES